MQDFVCIEIKTRVAETHIIAAEVVVSNYGRIVRWCYHDEVFKELTNRILVMHQVAIT